MAGLLPYRDGRRWKIRVGKVTDSDQNVIDVEFSVLWRIKPGSVSDYLFNAQNPEGTVKAVAESAMREVIGRLNVQPLLTGGSKVVQDKIETSVPDLVQSLMQRTLDSYNAGVLVQNVQISRINPPAQVMDSFLDVQAARSVGGRRAMRIGLAGHGCRGFGGHGCRGFGGCGWGGVWLELLA